MAPAIFISFSSRDRGTAVSVCNALEARGLFCWIAPRNVRPGQPYAQEIVSALSAAKVVVIILSSHSNASQHVCREIELASTHHIPVIPLRTENVAPDGALKFFLSSVQWFDALDGLPPERLDAFAGIVSSHVPGTGSTSNTRVVRRVPSPRAWTWWPVLVIGAAVLVLTLWAAYHAWQPPEARTPDTLPTRSVTPPDGGGMQHSPSPTPISPQRVEPPRERGTDRGVVTSPTNPRCSQLLERVSLGDTLSTEDQTYLRQNCG